MCVFVYLKYKFASIYLFLFVSITTCNTIAERVSGQFVETSYTSVENVGEGGLEYYKLMGEPQKGGGDQILKSQWG